MTKMGSDNNCNNFYNGEQNSASNMSSTPYYQTLSSQNGSSQSSVVQNVNNEWISTEQNREPSEPGQNHDSESEMQHREQNGRSENSSRSQKSYQQHIQMSAPQWNFPSALGSTYQRFYGDSHYGIVISPNVSHQSSLVSTPSSSLHSLNEVQPSHNHHVHQMQTNQHLKKIYYQGLSKQISHCLPSLGANNKRLCMENCCAVVSSIHLWFIYLFQSMKNSLHKKVLRKPNSIFLIVFPQRSPFKDLLAAQTCKSRGTCRLVFQM